MAKSVMVIGLGRFGTSVAHTLFQLGYDVLGIDTDERVVQANLGQLTYSVQGDATNETTLRELGVTNFDAAIVAVGSDMQSSLMTSVLLATLDVPLIIARAENPLHGNTLQRIGVHKIIYPEQEMGEFLAHSLFNPDVLEYMDLTPDFGISKIKVPDSLADKSLKDAGLGGGARDKYGVAVIAIKRGKDVTLAPDEDDILHKGDILVVAAKDEQLERLHPRQQELGHEGT
ncbi:MAG: TrkA family potassium uptake protein [Chloroflexi bacterium]|nr:TrkA family potassium uptake protein [Chloroflexota bacterium]